MTYSICFYGIDPQQFARDTSDVSATVAETVRRASASGNLSDEQLALLESLIRQGLTGGWPKSDEPDAFIAFYWLMETVAEHIMIEPLVEFQRWNYWQLTELDHAFFRKRPPISPPTSPLELPKIGYIYSTDMPGIISEAVSREMPREVFALRTELLSVMESLSEDKLDLLAIFLN